MERRIKGEVTVFFTLIFVVFLSFINSMLFLASVQISKNQAKTSVNLAVNSVFAEYQRELLEEYDIFALEGSYESGNYSVSNITNRMSYYGAAGMKHEVKGIQYLTDDEGAAFYEQAVKSVLGKYGLPAGSGNLSDNSKEQDLWKKQEEYTETYDRQESAAQAQTEQILEEQELDLGEENPFEFLKKWKKSGLLTLVLPKEQELSNKCIDLSEQVSQRELNQGYGEPRRSSGAGLAGMSDRVLFGRYIADHFACFTSEEQDRVLQYEQEYLIAGKASDSENLEAVCRKILRMRLGANYLYLNTDESKKAEARAAAVLISGTAGIPALSEAVLQGILAAWAYAESISDVKCLLSGEKVSLVKTASEWKMDLEHIWNIGAEEFVPAIKSDKGLSYEQYLEMILFLKSINNVKMRSLDIVENNLRLMKGKSFFWADYCVSRIKFDTEARMERGITYSFDTEFGYE